MFSFVKNKKQQKMCLGGYRECAKIKRADTVEGRKTDINWVRMGGMSVTVKSQG